MEPNIRPAYSRAKQALAAAGVQHVIHTHRPVRTMQDVVDNLTFCKGGELLKSVVLRTSSRWVIAVLRGPDRVDYRKLASVLDIERRDLIRPSPEEVENYLGAEVGGIGPVGQGKLATICLDGSLRDCGRVFCGVGRNDATLEIAFADLVLVCEGQVVDIRQDGSSTG